MTTKNIGKWSATKDVGNKKINVNGSFPTRQGQKPLYSLEKNDPQGVIDTELVLTLKFGALADENGLVFFDVNYFEEIENNKNYLTVIIVDDNNRTIANIEVKTQ